MSKLCYNIRVLPSSLLALVVAGVLLFPAVPITAPRQHAHTADMAQRLHAHIGADVGDQHLHQLDFVLHTVPPAALLPALQLAACLVITVVYRMSELRCRYRQLCLLPPLPPPR